MLLFKKGSRVKLVGIVRGITASSTVHDIWKDDRDAIFTTITDSFVGHTTELEYKGKPIGLAVDCIISAEPILPTELLKQLTELNRNVND